jgi:hypothetical protein
MRSSSGRAPAADYNAKRNRIIDLQILEENVSKLQNYCYDEKNFKVPVIEQVLDASGLGADSRDPFLHGPGDELRSRQRIRRTSACRLR